MAALQALGKDHPIDQAVMQGLVSQDCYETSPELCRYVLWLYEEYLADKHGPGATVDPHDRAAIWKMRASDSIEHVFPQNPSGELGWKGKMHREGQSAEPVAQHVGRIGNLVLLPIVLNQAAKTKPFRDKRVIYAAHKLRMIEHVCNEPDWTLAQIESREAQIIEFAKRRWSDL
jgi:hypothetical protein